MKATGMVRKVDELGRIVIPMEIRASMGVQFKDPMEIFVEEDRIVLKKYTPSCLFCKNTENLKDFNDKRICPSCLERLKEL